MEARLCGVVQGSELPPPWEQLSTLWKALFPHLTLEPEFHRAEGQEGEMMGGRRRNENKLEPTDTRGPRPTSKTCPGILPPLASGLWGIVQKPGPFTMELRATEALETPGTAELTTRASR